MIETMNKYIALGIGLVVVGFVFFGPLKNLESNRELNNEPLNLNLPNPTLEVPGVSSTGVGIKAWNVFQEYLQYAKNHDLENLKKISHQLSPACEDKERKAECEQLMDNVVFFTQDFKQSDFGQTDYDDKQIVMQTNYLSQEGYEEKVKTVVYFTRTNEGEPRILSIRFCLSIPNEPETKCVDTNKNTRDKDKNGWWDDVEALFR